MLFVFPATVKVYLFLFVFVFVCPAVVIKFSCFFCFCFCFYFYFFPQSSWSFFCFLLFLFCFPRSRHQVYLFFAVTNRQTNASTNNTEYITRPVFSWYIVDLRCGNCQSRLLAAGGYCFAMRHAIVLCVCLSVRPSAHLSVTQYETKCSTTLPRPPHYIFDLEKTKFKIKEAKIAERPKVFKRLTLL